MLAEFACRSLPTTPTPPHRFSPIPPYSPSLSFIPFSYSFPLGKTKSENTWPTAACNADFVIVALEQGQRDRE